MTSTPVDGRTRRLVFAAREIAFGGYFDDGDVHQMARIKELDEASEAFADDVPWADEEEAFWAASGMETRSAIDSEAGVARQGDSPTGEAGDAQRNPS